MKIEFSEDDVNEFLEDFAEFLRSRKTPKIFNLAVAGAFLEMDAKVMDDSAQDMMVDIWELVVSLSKEQVIQ